MLYSRNLKKIQLNLIVLILIFISNSVKSQKYSSNEIYHSLKQLNVLGSVLYIAAHPDDENTAVLAYMSKGKMMRTAYLSLTRGDGGQNLLGKENGDLLGVIRTEELLSARRIDGAQQYFTRAIDFGYSKTSKETLNNWNRELLLSDMVKVIRQFKPDVILTRFSKTQGGHGHHLTSAILAEEAFYAAADPDKFSEQLTELDPWKAKRLYWNTWQPSDNAISIDIGEYSTILGKSFNELAASSRSMHKSQGFGVSPTRGSQFQYFDYLAGDTAYSSIFEGIDLSWNRIKEGDEFARDINRAAEKFNAESPSEIIPDLIKIYQRLGHIENKFWANRKREEIKELIKMCAGLWMESTADQPEISPGESIDINNTILNRSDVTITLRNLKTSFANNDNTIEEILDFNKSINITKNITIPIDQGYTQPYWLKNKHNSKWFTISNEDVGKARANSEIWAELEVEIYGEVLTYKIPVIYKWNDAVKGEQKKPFVIIPELSLTVEQSSLVFPNGTSHKLNVNIVSKTNSAAGKVFIELPEGWYSDNKYFDFRNLSKSDQKSFEFNITPNKKAETGVARIIAEMNGKVFSQEIIQIDYPHIDFQTVLKPSVVELVKLDINIEPRKIGYIMGSGDEIPLSLKQIGYNVDMISSIDLDVKDLSIYDVIICGVRAFNTREELDRQQSKLNEFVYNGGTWIVQHNTRFGFQANNIGPYNFSTNGRDRISEEDSPIKILIPNHQLFNFPNRITQNDFNGWVQERGLYFADSWGEEFEPLLAGHDTGESDKFGGLLYSEYGKGVFIFTAYSWFRQLPAGVPGAYRIFVNLISAKGNYD